jgi:hypothetical protein
MVAAAIALGAATDVHRAGALPTDIATAPTTGAVGTTVTINGSGCQGTLLGPARVNVLALTLGVSRDVTPDAAGVWSTQFTVPANALTVPHAITASCLVAGLLPVPYLPQTFTVLAGPPATTSTTTSTTVALTATTSVHSPTTGVSTSVAATSGPATTSADPLLDPNIVVPPPGITVTRPQGTTSSTTTGSTIAPADDAQATDEARISAARSGDGTVAFESAERHWGWLAWVVWVLVVIVVLSGLVAAAWFAWLRQTRARLWWERWLQQVARVRGLGRS